MLALDQSAADAFSPEDMLAAGPMEVEKPKEPEVPAAAPAVEDAKPAPKPKPKPPVDVTEEDRDAFMRHVLGGGRLIKSYSAAKGGMQIKMKTRTVAEDDILHAYVVANARAGLISSSPIATDYVVAIYREYLCYSLHTVQIGTATLSMPADALTLQERGEWIRTTFSEIQLRFLLRALEDFETLMAVLYAESVSSDFTAGRAGVI